jgi:diaminobutyrate-2-oxoglutarate transaminase
VTVENVARVADLEQSTIFERLESEVRSYCRDFPAVFKRAEGAILEDVAGRRWIDLLAGAGTLNYGHNNPSIMEHVIGYLAKGGIVHSLDLHTEAKSVFLETFERLILAPRQLNYRVQFPGPTGTNAVEAALKLARKVTGRHSVVAFTGAYHGMSLGALAATANSVKRAGAGVPLGSVHFLPYEGRLGPEVDTAAFAQNMLEESGSGMDLPAAIILELVQGEGGLNTCSARWYAAIAELAQRIGALLIVDDIQAGCGRTGTFFSFEGLNGVAPDLIVLSKALSGFGTPLSILLIRPDLDIWRPGEHNGTFRGNNLGFVGATAALETYWSDNRFVGEVREKAATVRGRLTAMVRKLPPGAATLRGRGLMTGLAFADRGRASRISADLFSAGVIAETCGPHGEVLKLLPPLTISHTLLTEALDGIEATVV